MKRIIGFMLIGIAFIFFLYAFNMSIITPDEATRNLEHAFERLGSIQTEPDTIANPDLVNARTNYFIISGILSVIGVILIVIPKNRIIEIKSENSSSADEILKLHSLKEKGLLSEDEFIKQKNKILNN